MDWKIADKIASRFILEMVDTGLSPKEGLRLLKHMAHSLEMKIKEGE